MNAAIGRFAWSRLRSVWVSLILLVLILAVCMGSVSEAQWLDDSRPLVSMLLLGMIFGILLSRLRWPGWFAGLYSLVASLFVALQTIGRVLPSPAALLSQSLPEVGWGIRLRLLNLFDRMSGWVGSLNRGENVTDTGLFVLVFGVVAWAAAAWLAWSILRRGRALGGLLPLGLLLGANVYLSSQGTLYLWLYILLSLLVIARVGWSDLHQDWERRGVDYPDDLSEWMAGAAIASLLVAAAVYLLPVVGTPEGWDLIGKWTRSLREQTAETTERLFSDVNPADIEAYALHAVTPNLRTIGDPVSTGRETVMWVALSDPPPPPTEMSGRLPMPPQHYWRNEILVTYNGGGWDPAGLQAVRSIPAGSAGPPAGRYALDQSFELVANHGEILFSASEPALPGEGTSLRFARPDGSALLAGASSNYEVTSYAPLVTAGQLRSDAGSYPPEILDAYTQLPASLPGRVRTMADRVAGQAESAYDKALLLQTYLRETYPYNIDVPPPPAGRDAVEYFLYEAQEGFCSYYASAMAVMLRAQGVPARVVTGFAIGEYDSGRSAYRVPLSASHAWVEVYFPSYGWIEFEPTPARSVFEYPDEAAPVQGAPGTLEPEPEPRGIFSNARSLALVASGALLALLLFLGGIRLWDHHRRREELNRPTGQATGLYWEMRRALARAGMRTGASTTPAEFLAAYGPSLAERARLLNAVQLATLLYQRASFSPLEPNPEEIARTRNAWRQAFPERVDLRLSVWWRRISRKKAGA